MALPKITAGGRSRDYRIGASRGSTRRSMHQDSDLIASRSLLAGNKAFQR